MESSTEEALRGGAAGLGLPPQRQLTRFSPRLVTRVRLPPALLFPPALRFLLSHTMLPPLLLLLPLLAVLRLLLGFWRWLSCCVRVDHAAQLPDSRAVACGGVPQLRSGGWLGLGQKERLQYPDGLLVQAESLRWPLAGAIHADSLVQEGFQLVAHRRSTFRKRLRAPVDG